MIERNKRIVELYNKYRNKTQVANLVGVSPRTVGRVLEKESTQLVKPANVVRLGGVVAVANVWDSPAGYNRGKLEAKKEPPKVPFWRFGSDFVEIMHEEELNTANSEHPKFKEICDILFKSGKDYDKVIEALTLMSVKKGISEFSKGLVNIKNGIVKYCNYAVDNTLTKRIIDSMNKGEDFERYIKFFEKLMQNPSSKAVNELYSFLEFNDIEIMEDGNILTYKKVTKDFKDIYTKTFDNSIGSEPSMPRCMVDDDSEVTCSRGLHVCAKHYLPHFGDSKNDIVIECSVDPRDVVCIPKDYKNSKMRLCRYKVLCVAD